MLALATLPACVRTPRGFDSPDPNARLDAIRAAADGRDDLDESRRIQLLISQLEATDPAARLMAIRALEKRTGNTFGYHYGDEPRDRAAAIGRWKTWARGLDDNAGVREGPADSSGG